MTFRPTRNLNMQHTIDRTNVNGTAGAQNREIQIPTIVA